MPEDAIRLLIVEDELSTRMALAQIFAHAGYSVRCASDGFSALQQIREAIPDILLSDLNMPGMSGFELLSVVRRRLPAIYVIATSGAYFGDEVPLGIPADAFYEKSSNFGCLLRLVENASRSRGTSVRASSSPPIWVSRTDDEPPGERYVMISCPECLRPFPQAFADLKTIIHEVDCIYCSGAIRFAVVQPLDPVTSQPYVHRPKSVASRPPATVINAFRKSKDNGEGAKRTCA